MVMLPMNLKSQKSALVSTSRYVVESSSHRARVLNWFQTEHIDNPKGYGDGEDARKYHPKLRGPVDVSHIIKLFMFYVQTVNSPKSLKSTQGRE